MNAVIRAIARGFPSACCGDIGCANWGTVRQMLGWLPNPPRRFLAVEPDPRNLDLMRREGIPPGVELAECAIGSCDGPGTLLLSDSDEKKAFGGMWSVSSSLRRPARHLQAYPWVKFERHAPVQVRSLDSLCRERGIDGFDILWVDIQGSERDLVEGGAATLDRTKYLFIEAEKEEMYAGQWTRAQLLEAMPRWAVVGEWTYDVLLRNRDQP